MMQCEFEALAMRGSGSISPLLYQSIEHFYTAENEYHKTHGGIDETKHEFVKRAFGGKVNTPKTILAKAIKMAQDENRFALMGCNVSKTRLDEMDALIAEHYNYLANFHF